MKYQDIVIAISWANLLWQECCLSIPVNVHYVCEHIGLQIIRRADITSTLNGFYMPVNDNHKYIFINSNHCENRQRYCIMHEAAHYFIDKLRPKISAQRRERFCQTFAANVLMPEYELTHYCSNNNFKIADLARKFKVSKQAMEIRLRELKIATEISV